MEKSRSVKFLTIIALVMSVFMMTLGFAAFSTSLNISSSASVTPDSDEFKLQIYGFETYEDASVFMGGIANNNIDYSLLNSTSSAAVSWQDDMSGEMAVIDNSTLSISNMNVSFSRPNADKYISYFFVIRNEGKYNAYLDVEEFNNYTDFSKTCNILDDKYSVETSSVCDYIFYDYLFYSSKMSILSGNIVIPANDFVLFSYYLKYTDVYVDAPIIVEFNNLRFPFTTKPST